MSLVRPLLRESRSTGLYLSDDVLDRFLKSVGEL